MVQVSRGELNRHKADDEIGTVLVFSQRCPFVLIPAFTSAYDVAASRFALSHKNAVEQAIWGAVVRKICGGTRSAHRSAIKMLLFSLLETCVVCGLDPVTVLTGMLGSHPLFTSASQYMEYYSKKREQVPTDKLLDNST